MSKLTLRDNRGVRFRLNVTQFRSTMSASIDSVQVREMLHHYPIRAGQPDIEFTVLFRSTQDKHDFQNFIRNHQRNAQKVGKSGLVTLNWPQRDIVNWTGYIMKVPVREVRFEYAPKLTFGVMLVDSLMSTLTTTSSRGATWWSIAGPQIPRLDFTPPIRPPTPPAALQTAPQNTETPQRAPLSSLADFLGGLFS